MKLFQISLAWQMVLASIAGVLFGLFFGEWCSVFAPWGSAYIMILKITTIPYLAFAIMHGVGQLRSSHAIQILKKGLFFIALFWAINIVMIYLTAFLFPKASGAALAGYVTNKPTGINFAQVLIPENIFYSLSNNVVPSVVIFSLLVGLSLMHIKEKSSLMQMLEAFVGSLTKITAWISRITPFGTFLIIANQVGTIQLATIKQMGTYIILYILCLSIVIFWIFPRIVSLLTNISMGRWIRHLFPILVLGYTTNVVLVCIPFIIELIKKELQRIVHTDEKIEGEIQGIVAIVFNLPLGSLFITVFIFFVSIFYSIPLGLSGQLQLFISAFLTSLGSVGLGAWINSLTFILDTLGLPVEAINIYLSTLPFVAGFQSMASVMEISSLSLFITFACNGFLKVPSLFRFIRSATFTAGPVIALVLLLKSFNPLPKIQNTMKSIYDVSIGGMISKEAYVTQTTPVSASPQAAAAPAPAIANEDTFDRVLRTKTLRVGCNLLAVPFSFCNNFGQIVGYDIAYAKELADDLGCRLELVPLSFNRIAEELNEGVYDIGMSGLSMTEDRLKNIYFSTPYLESPVILVTTEKFRKIVEKESICAHPEWRIAVLKGGAFECHARLWFPNNPVIALDDYDAFAKEPYQADVLLWSEEEAISWVARFPRFVIVNPNIGVDALAYAVKFGSTKFLIYLREWLKLKELSGFKQEQYKLWILGQTNIAEEETRRWTILHDVLHWGEKAENNP